MRIRIGIATMRYKVEIIEIKTDSNGVDWTLSRLEAAPTVVQYLGVAYSRYEWPVRCRAPLYRAKMALQGSAGLS